MDIITFEEELDMLENMEEQLLHEGKIDLSTPASRSVMLGALRTAQRHCRMNMR